MQQLASASPSDALLLVSSLFMPYRFVRGQDGMQIIIRDAAFQAIHSLHAAGSSDFNLVQQSLWPQTPFVHASAEVTEDVPDLADEPGAWSSNSSQASSRLQPTGSMAYSMRVGRILRPVSAPAANDMREVSPQTFAVKAFASLLHTSPQPFPLQATCSDTVWACLQGKRICACSCSVCIVPAWTAHGHSSAVSMACRMLCTNQTSADHYVCFHHDTVMCHAAGA